MVTKRPDRTTPAPGVASPASCAQLAGGRTPPQPVRLLRAAHDRFVATGVPEPGLRPLVVDSWRRCSSSQVDPDTAAAPITFGGDELTAYRQHHKLAAVMPVVRELLVSDAGAESFLVVVSDGAGRLLWVEGDHPLRSRAEQVHLVEGASWHEEHAGTNAAGTSLVLARPVQVSGPEHFRRTVQPFSCTAVPVREPVTGAVLGTVTVAGDARVAAPHALTMVKAVVAAAEGELRLRQLVGTGRHVATGDSHVEAARLRVLGQDAGVLHVSGRSIRLSQRHAEVLLLLATHPEGLTAEQLSVRLHRHDVPAVTVRAEMSRLRRILGGSLLTSRPYRLLDRVETDIDELRRALDLGAFERALDLYTGPLLPHSDAPAIVSLRAEISRQLRDALLGHAPADVLLRYAEDSEGSDDVEVWQACLDLLPAASVTRTRVRSQLHWLHRQLSAAT